MISIVISSWLSTKYNDQWYNDQATIIDFIMISYNWSLYHILFWCTHVFRCVCSFLYLSVWLITIMILINIDSGQPSHQPSIPNSNNTQLWDRMILYWGWLIIGVFTLCDIIQYGDHVLDSEEYHLELWLCNILMSQVLINMFIIHSETQQIWAMLHHMVK